MNQFDITLFQGGTCVQMPEGLHDGDGRLGRLRDQDAPVPFASFY